MRASLALDDVLAETGPIAGPGTAGVDRGGHARGAAELVGIDAERGAAPVDVGVQVDQAGRDDIAGDVAHFRGALQILAEAGDLAVGEGDVEQRRRDSARDR